MITKTFATFTIVGLGVTAGPLTHPRQCQGDGTRLWQLAKHVNRTPHITTVR